MTSRRTLIALAVLVIAIVAIAASYRQTRTHAKQNETQLATTAAVEGLPVAPTTTPAPPTQTQTKPQSAAPPASIATTTDPAPVVASHTTAASAAQQPIDQTKANGDIRDSQLRLNAIEELAKGADDLFSTPGLADSTWTVNQQGLDQQDYQTENADITAWLGQDDNGTGVVRAQEAVMTDGTVVDRWFNDDGGVEQVMRQYDKNNSYSAYYYPSGEIEATRVVKDGAEIFIRYDRDGREIQRSYTPASSIE